MSIISNSIKKLRDNQFKGKWTLDDSMVQQFDIHIAESDAELNEIYQFRYKIYVEQLQRNQKYASHTLKEIREPLDRTAYNIGAWKNNELVGVVRLNIKEKGDFGYYNALYKTSLFSEFIDKSSIVTKLMVTKQFRKTSLSLLLSLECYKILWKNKIELNFIDCNSYLVNYFLALGYRYYIPNIQHPEYGKVIPLVLIIQDIDYFEKINSPFLSICKQHKTSAKGVAFYNKKFSTFHNQQIKFKH